MTFDLLLNFFYCFLLLFHSSFCLFFHLSSIFHHFFLFSSTYHIYIYNLSIFLCLLGGGGGDSNLNGCFPACFAMISMGHHRRASKSIILLLFLAPVF